MPSSASFFVSGRVCLVGEHSDWAGQLRSTNPALSPGCAIVAGTQEGLQVSAHRRPDGKLRLSSALGGDAEYEPGALLAGARGASPWRYAAGVAYVVMDRWRVTGAALSIQSDLPAGKGLSSSAALAVAVARAFNRLYQLGLSVTGEMELAYSGERLTGSLCGRMDQCVALGKGHIARFDFDGDVTTHALLPQPTSPIYIVFADLAAAKDTKIILRDLQSAVTSGDHDDLVAALGPRNQHIVARVADALGSGNAELLGALYEEAQQLFDSCAMPCCPDQLTAPRLHMVIADPRVRPLVYGAKGVGSQGDGAVQLVARGKAEADELELVLQSMGMHSAHILSLGAPCADASGARVGPAAADQAEVDLNHALPVKRKVKTAVITAAGYGTRLFPASRSIVPKSLVPIIDSDGYVKPLLLSIVELCVRDGMEKVVIVTGPGKQAERVREIFSKVEGGLAKALKPWMRDYAASIAELEGRVTVTVQDTPQGFGDAVSKAAPYLKDDEPFVLLLGDVIFKVPSAIPSCLRQCLDVFERDPKGRSVVGVSDVPVADAGAYGVIQSSMDADIHALHVGEFIEKPSKEQAAALAVNGSCKIVLGPYVFTHDVMKALLEDVAADARLNGEIQLTPAVARVKDVAGLLAVSLEGEALDTGNPQEYAGTMVKLSEHVLC